MRKLKLFFACLLMAVLSIGQMWGAKITTLSGITSGKSYYIGATVSGTDYYLKTKDGIEVGTGLQGTSTTSTSDAAVVTLTGSASSWTMQFSNGNYLSLASSKANGKYDVVATAATWTFTESSSLINMKINGYCLMKNSGTSLNFGSYASGQNDVWLEEVPSGNVDVTGVSLDEDDIVLEVGATQTLVATVEPSGATNKNVSWESNDENVASVDENGVVTAEGIGTAIITVTTQDGDFTATCDVEVIAAQPKITITATDVTDFTTTYDEYSWSAGGISGKMYAYKQSGMQFNSGKDGSYVYNTVAVPGYIRSITITTYSGKTSRTWTPYVSDAIMTDADTEKALEAKLSSESGTKWTVTGNNTYFYLLESGGATNISSIVIGYEEVVSTVATPEISATGDDYGKTVTITAEDGAEIYYTLNGDIPTATSTHYTAPFALTESKTVKAIAIKNDESSNVASETYTIYPTYSTIAQLKANAVNNTPKDIRFEFSDIQVTYINGGLAYISDGNEGALIYKSNIGNVLSVGKIINGTLNTKLQGYYGDAELTEFDATNLTITDGTVPVQTKSLATDNLTTANISMVVDLGLLTYDATNVAFKDDNNNSIKYRNQFNVSNLPTLENGAQYNVKGLLISYSSALNIAPRSEEDITVPATSKSTAETQWVATSKTVRMGDATTGWWSTESDGAKSFSSTNEDVATINATTGAITLVAPGTTTLKFSTAESDDYFAGPEVSMVLTVKAALPTGGVEFTWDATAQSYTDQAVMGTVTAAPNPIIAFANTGSNDPKWFNNGSAVRFYKDNSITITAPEGNLLYEININFVSGYTKTITTDVVTYNLAGTVGTWSGLAKEVIFSNGDGAARLTSINVIYAPGTVTELAIADINLKTTDGETALGITKNVDAPIIYEGLDESVATISANKVTPFGEGSTTVTARIEQGSNYTAAETTFTITVAAKTIPALSFPQASYDANLGESFEAPALTNLEGVTVLYSSDNAAVSVDENTGAITLNAEGTAVITATSVETTDYAVNTASYTLNVIDPYKDVITAAGIGLTSYTDWSKSFTSTTVYAGNSTANNGDIQLRKSTGAQDKSGIITTSVAGYLKYLYASAGNNENATGHYLNVYAKNTAYVSVADLYDDAKCGTLIGTISEDGGEIDFVDDKDYVDNYKYIALKSNNGAAYYGEIIIKWTPATFNTYTVTYEPGEATGEDVVIDNIEEGTEITLAADDTYSKEGYTFMGWSDGVNTYAAGAKYEVNSDVTFTAQWAQNFTVTYKAGEAGETQVVRTVPAGAYNLESCSFAYANHAFDGWQNGSNKYNAGAAITISENMEFVATWVTALAPVTVTFTVTEEKSSTKTLYKDGINLSVTGGDLNRTDNYRCYASNSMNIATELGNITNIVITSVEGNTAQAFSIEGDNGNYAYESLIGTWTGSSAAIQLNASSQVRMTQIQVTYIPSAYLRNVTDANNFGTLCLPFNGTIEGAELLEFVDKDADNVYLGDADASVLAGKPYIFRSTAAQIKVSFTDNNFVAATDNNGLHGTYVRMENGELNGTCLISNNQYYNIDTDDCSLNAYRAYFMLSEVPSIGGNLARRRYAIGNGAPQVATGVDTLNASETPVKMIIDGQLYILRGEKLFDATGRLVK